MKEVNIVYYCWCNINKNYKNIIFGQLDDIINCGILNISKIHIVCCCEDVKIMEEVKLIFESKLKCYEYEINFHTENRYEYYGIKKLYDLSNLEPDKYFIYLHSKGMFNYGNINERHIYETTLTNGTFYNFPQTINLFHKNPDIIKAALFPAFQHQCEFCWLNFFWAKGSYLITCDNPIITNDRYYYERWSESGDNSLGKVYNLYENNYKKYQLHEVAGILIKLNGSFQPSN